MQRHHRPHVLACATLYLAQFILEQSNMEVPQVRRHSNRCAQNDDWILVAVQTMHHFPWWEVYDASKQELEQVSTGLLDSLQTLLAIPFDTALTVYQEYVEKYSPPLPRQLVNASTAGSAPG